MRLVFFGTPDFAAAVLHHLLRSGEEVAAVVTAPDKPAGRGMLPQASPVKKLAERHGICLLQPNNLKDSSLVDTLKKLNAEVFVVVAFRKLPAEVWTLPARGTINLHASLLPAYRGAAPIHHAIMNGETVTGLTTFFINDKIDEGRIILQKRISIDENDTAGTVYQKMMQKGPPLVLETLRWLETHTYEDVLPQNSPESAPLAPKLTTENTRINWNHSPEQIRNFIRGLSPQPGAWCLMLKKDGSEELWKILEARAETEESDTLPDVKPGQPVIMDRILKIRCQCGWLVPDLIQRQGKKAQNNRDFLNGLYNAGFHLKEM